MTSVGVASVMDDQDSDEDETHPLPILGANPTADEEGSKEQEDTDLSYGRCGWSVGCMKLPV